MILKKIIFLFCVTALISFASNNAEVLLEDSFETETSGKIFGTAEIAEGKIGQGLRLTGKTNIK